MSYFLILSHTELFGRPKVNQIPDCHHQTNKQHTTKRSIQLLIAIWRLSFIRQTLKTSLTHRFTPMDIKSFGQPLILLHLSVDIRVQAPLLHIVIDPLLQTGRAQSIQELHISGRIGTLHLIHQTKVGLIQVLPLVPLLAIVRECFARFCVDLFQVVHHSLGYRGPRILLHLNIER